jgi:hypothetical protein
MRSESREATGAVDATRVPFIFFYITKSSRGHAGLFWAMAHGRNGKSLNLDCGLIQEINYDGLFYKTSGRKNQTMEPLCTLLLIADSRNARALQRV